MRYIVILILAGLTIFSCFQAKELYALQKKQTLIKEDFSEINKINHGLFNVELWKDKALNIFDAKIKDFEIDPKMYKEVNRQLVTYLNQVYDEYIGSGKLIDQAMEEAQKNGSVNKLFLKLIKGSAKDMLDGFDLKAKIPGVANELTKEIKSNEHVIKKYMTDELNSMLFSGAKSTYQDPRIPLLKKYEEEDFDVLSQNLTEKSHALQEQINEKLQWIYGLLILCILIAAFGYSWIKSKILILSYTIISVIMLILGISLPMIDIDARLNSFALNLVGNEINFGEQVMYFQSKSILDVTQTLINSAGIDTKVVGILVFLFSIVFPFFKLLLSTLYLFVEKVKQSKLAQTVIFYLGKWSMADVFVVAIFMAYIGFYGIIASQLGEISSSTRYEVETINYSKLSPGALFFTSYCILSIITSIIISRTNKKAASLV